jgi:hypothetical protein
MIVDVHAHYRPLAYNAALVRPIGADDNGTVKGIAGGTKLIELARQHQTISA